MTPLDKAVVAILDQNNHICGAGFLAAERLIVTCAHVVTTAQKAGSVLKGRFHLDGAAQELTLAVDGWFPEQDVAILECTIDPSALTQPLPLGSGIDCAGHDFITLGYPHLGDYVGIPARGTIDGQAPKANGQLMLKLSAASVAQGHSGAPVFDETWQKVVGMVGEVFHPDSTGKHRDTAFAIPMETIWDLFPTLKPDQNRTNPFYVGGRINDPKQFFGRQRFLREVKSMLQNRSNVSIVGESQIGKSSLLYYLYATRAEWEPHASVVYVDLQGVWDLEDFCITVLERLGQKGNTPRDLRNALQNSDTILLLDEIEQINDPAFTDKLPNLMRAIAQEKQLAFCISSQKPLVEIFTDPLNNTSPFHNIFSEKQLRPFTEAEAINFLTTRLASTDVQFSDKDVEKLLQESSGHPARLQTLAQQLFEQYRD